MEVKIENRYLKPSIELLFNLPLRGKESRQRTKFIKRLQKRLEEVENDRIELAREYAKIDEKGNPIVKHDRYDIGDVKSFEKELNELYNEKMVIDGGDSEEMLKTVKEVLLNCNKEFSGSEAIVYDYLCDQFEKI
ncbi:DUF1617 family protein [Fervidibacillus albus]|uniref:DUF1617 family protein n=1 Tax=Fervidibacillus albus TaxID=2980026 RepID=A0A9E8LVH2_9BACI|nr:DUF1617 family protein [Fervidibacillus albus]WAA10339.1 DUF1617 family protein [Fervidibacillus albus]